MHQSANRSTPGPTVVGKFVHVDDRRFLIKGVAYGTFAPDADGYQFPAMSRVREDFGLMRQYGVNTVRTYTPPRLDLLDEAARHGLRVMVGLPWSQHEAFLDDRRLARSIRRKVVRQVEESSHHPAVLTFALGNEIPAPVVRWHGLWVSMRISLRQYAWRMIWGTRPLVMREKKRSIS